MMVKLGVRWTIGSVSKRGFEALRLSIHGAVLVFGEEAAYAVYVNSMTIEEARTLTGPVPNFVEWRYASTEVPAVLSGYMDAGMAEGVAWKFAPLSAFPDRHELALDNDVILWQAPGAIRQWLDERPEARVLAEDVALGHGAFSYLCGPEPRNSGIRGTPLGYDFADALGRTLCNAPVQLQSELDEQGLQIAALSLDGPPLVVTTAEVTICSPFWPHQWHLGYCGAHFVGLNPECIPWTYYERSATQVASTLGASPSGALRACGPTNALRLTRGDKRSGHVADAVDKLRRLVGMGESYYPTMEYHNMPGHLIKRASAKID